MEMAFVYSHSDLPVYSPLPTEHLLDKAIQGARIYQLLPAKPLHCAHNSLRMSCYPAYHLTAEPLYLFTLSGSQISLALSSLARV